RARGVSDRVAALVARCLSVDPAGRPRSAGEVRAALAGGRPTSVPPRALEPTLETPPAPEVRSRGPSTTGTSCAAPSLPVPPVRYWGPDAQMYLGEALTGELVDLLSRTRGLRVFGQGATARFGDDRDPVNVGRKLGVFAVVDGTVHVAGDRVRVTARLLDA